MMPAHRRMRVCSNPGCPTLIEYGDWCDSHHPTRARGYPDYDDLTPAVLLELATGASEGGGPRERSDAELLQYWERWRLAIHDHFANRPTRSGHEVERVWACVARDYAIEKPTPLWAEEHFNA